MAEERKNRSLELREAATRTPDKWVQQGILATPDPQDGWVFHWVRTATLGKSDNSNVSKRFREGWTPVKAEDHPECEMIVEFGSRFEGNIEQGGLLLCKAPEELMRQRTEHFANQANKQMESVDNSFFRENDPRMPLSRDNIQRTTRTQFGKG
jgi:hypothetical protein